MLFFAQRTKRVPKKTKAYITPKNPQQIALPRDFKEELEDFNNGRVTHAIRFLGVPILC